MLPSAYSSGVRFGAASFAVAGISFELYPAIRSFSDETSLQGAVAFASAAWIGAHMLAMIGFTLLALGLLGVDISLQDSAVERPAFWAVVLSWIGVGLRLPFYGGEAFGLHAIGQEAVKEKSAALVGLASVIRSGPELLMFVVGLLLLAVGTFLAASATWTGRYPKWSGMPLALGCGLYIPPVFRYAAIPGGSRIAGGHGLSVASCRLVAAEPQRRTRKLTSAQRSFEGLLVSLAVGYFGEWLAFLPTQTESMRRVPQWENGQNVKIIWDGQDRLHFGRPEEPDPVRADSF